MRKNENITIHTTNKKIGIEGVASFLYDDKFIKVYEGDGNGSDDKIMTYEDFINNYSYYLADIDENIPLKINSKGGINIFEKNDSLKVSEEFFNVLEDKLTNKASHLNGYYKTFNNCREQGLVLTLYNDDSNTDNDLIIWACQSRNSDQIMVIIGDRSCSNINDMFNDIAWQKAKYFKYKDYYSATNYAYNIIKKQFKKNFKENINYNFNMNYCLSDLEKILNDANDLDYKDYHELVTFEDEDKKYFCDLIIFEGVIGLRYSKYYDEDDFDSISFKKWDPDLTSNATLMLGMQQKLNEFIDEEEDYDMEFINDIKI